MARVLRMPGVAANATEAVLAEWLVVESGDFEASDAIATVETEKAAIDLEADADGRMLKVLVPAGTQVDVGDPIAVLGEAGEVVDDLEALLASLGVAPVSDGVVPERRDLAGPTGSVGPAVDEVRAPGPPNPLPVDRRAERVFASPLARKLAKDAGLSIADLAGTGPRGRILRRDVEAAVSAHPPATAPATDQVAPAPTPGTETAAYEEIPHSRARRATARRLSESKRQVPHFYLKATARAEALLALRAELNADAPPRISVNDLVLKAVAAAHRRVPEMNVTWTEDAVRRYHAADVAVAVATDRGLMTPVLRDVGSLTVSAVASAVRDAASRARVGRLRPEELEGGSIAVTNLGMFGVEEFAAIINPPQAAILAVGVIHDEPVVESGAIVPGTVLHLILSVDHRPVDGVIAARWLQVLVQLLEHPARALA